MAGVGSVGNAAGSFYTQQITSTAQKTSASSSSSAASCAPSSESNNGVSVKVSSAGKLMSDLQQLQQKNPAKFKEILTDFASKLIDLAKQQPDSSANQSLSGLATKIDDIANGGDLMQLFGPQKSHRSHYARGYQTQQSDAATQLNNQGGTSQQSPVAELFANFASQVSQALSA